MYKVVDAIPGNRVLKQTNYRDKELNKRSGQFDRPLIQVDIATGYVSVDRLEESRNWRRESHVTS